MRQDTGAAGRAPFWARGLVECDICGGGWPQVALCPSTRSSSMRGGQRGEGTTEVLVQLNAVPEQEASLDAIFYQIFLDGKETVEDARARRKCWRCSMRVPNEKELPAEGEPA